MLSTTPMTELSSDSSSPRSFPSSPPRSTGTPDSELELPVDDLRAPVDSVFGSNHDASMSKGPVVAFSPAYLECLNKQLEKLHPTEILRFCTILFPNLYQSTAFGLTGLVILDMLSKMQGERPDSQSVDLIFLDTLYHFKETLDLVERIKARYPSTQVHVFKPSGVETAEKFEQTYGEKLYETSPELYDWVAKVEPLHRAFAELHVTAIFTGRRRSQGGQRNRIPIIEVDVERGIFKINPLVNWSFEQVEDYIRENGVPYNALLDAGYKSVGDWHSTSPVTEGEDERAGRWKGQQKSECGIHNEQSRYAQFLQDAERSQPTAMAA